MIIYSFCLIVTMVSVTVVLLAAICCSFTQSVGQQHNLRCPDTRVTNTGEIARGRLVSSDQDLLPRTETIPGISARERGTDQRYPITDIVDLAQSSFWCAQPSEGNYVNMTFKEPVLIEGILSSGAFTGSLNHYVSNFSMIFAGQIGGKQLQFNKVFTSTAIDLKTYLNVSIVAQTFQFFINEVVADGDLFCWSLDLIGCTINEVENIQPQEVDACPMTSITKTTTVFVPETLNPTSSSVVSGLKSQQIDYIVIGIGAVVLIIGLAFIVIALFLMCTIIIWQRKKKSQNLTLNKRISTLAEVNNDVLYTTNGLMDNELYGINGEFESMQVVYEQPSESVTPEQITNPAYQSVPHYQSLSSKEMIDQKYSCLSPTTKAGKDIELQNDYESVQTMQ